MGEAAVPGLDVEVARAGALAEQERRRRAMGIWLLVGLAALGASLVLGVVPFLIGFVAVILSLYSHGPYVFGARGAVATDLGRGELRVFQATNATRVEVRRERGATFRGVVNSVRLHGWSPSEDHDEAVLFGNAEKGGFVVAVVGMADGSTRCLGIRAIRPA